MKKWMGVVVAAVLLPVVAAGFGCGRGPARTVDLTATTAAGQPLPGVAVDLGGQRQGETDAQGKLSFPFTGEAGEEVVVSATLERPGLRFKPWEQRLVVRKWDAARPETMRYPLDAKLEAAALSADVTVQAAPRPPRAPRCAWTAGR